MLFFLPDYDLNDTAEAEFQVAILAVMLGVRLADYVGEQVVPDSAVCLSQVSQPRIKIVKNRLGTVF